MNSQGRLSREEGAAIPGSYQFVYLFLFYRAIFVLTYAFAVEYRFQGLVFRFLPLAFRRGAAHEENGDQEEKTDSHKDGFIWIYNGLFA